MTIRRALFLAGLLGFAAISACTTTTQGQPRPDDSVEITTSTSKSRPSSPAPRTSSSAPQTSSTEDANEPEIRDLAARYVDTVNKNDETTMAQLNCAKRGGLLQIAAGGQPVAITDEFERAPVEDRYYIGLTIGGRPAPRLTIILQDGAWCVHD